MRIPGALLAVGTAMAISTTASAGSILVTGTQGARSASAFFEASGANLIVTLTNTSPSDAMVPTDVLTGVYFDVSGGALTLGRTSAVLGVGSVVQNGTPDPGGVVGGEWGYRGGLSGGPRGAAYGISSSGLGLFGPGDRFPGNNLNGPASLNGLEYGITTAGDNIATGNGGVQTPLIKNRVIFTLSGLPGGFNPAALIGNVSFQYGTDLSEPNVPQDSPVIPLPSAGAMGLAGLGALALRRRRV